MKTVTKTFSNEPFFFIEIVVKNGFIFKVDLQKAKNFSAKLYFSKEKDKMKVFEWLINYSQKKKSKKNLRFFPFSFTDFEKKVLDTLYEIPFGKTITYQEIANFCQNPNAYRAVGNACGKNPFPLFIPCHRVIQKNGNLGGFAWGLDMKKRLLKFEQ